MGLGSTEPNDEEHCGDEDDNLSWIHAAAPTVFASNNPTNSSKFQT
jgi:hypothetical protein